MNCQNFVQSQAVSIYYNPHKTRCSRHVAYIRYPVGKVLCCIQTPLPAVPWRRFEIFIHYSNPPAAGLFSSCDKRCQIKIQHLYVMYNWPHKQNIKKTYCIKRGSGCTGINRELKGLCQCRAIMDPSFSYQGVCTLQGWGSTPYVSSSWAFCRKFSSDSSGVCPLGDEDTTDRLLWAVWWWMEKLPAVS